MDLSLIKEFEGFREHAYNDGLGIPTVGYGTTIWPDGSPVKLGQSCTKEQAEKMLQAHVQNSVLPALNKIPHWKEMNANQQAALVSFAYNLGSSFFGGDNFTTISRRLKNKEWDRVPGALALYINPGSPVEAGLKRRRAAEATLWTKPSDAIA